MIQPKPNKEEWAKIQEAIEITAKARNMQEENIEKLCILSLGMGGLKPFDIGETGVDFEGILNFLRTLYKTRKL